jgi:hypothetical protein
VFHQRWKCHRNGKLNQCKHWNVRFCIDLLKRDHRRNVDFYDHCLLLNLLDHLANTQGRYTARLADPCDGLAIPSENASGHTRHDGLRGVLQFPKGGQTAQNEIPFGIRCIQFGTQAFCKTQLGLENTRLTRRLGPESFAQSPHRDLKQSSDFFVAPRGSLIATGGEHRSGHEGPTRLASGLLGIHDALEHATGILQDGFGQAGLGSQCVDGVKDAHPRAFSVVGHAPRRELGQDLLIFILRTPTTAHHGSVGGFGKEV